MPKILKSISFYIILFVVVFLIYSTISSGGGISQISFSEFEGLLRSEKIKEIVIEENSVTATLYAKEKGADGKEYKEVTTKIASVDILYQQVGTVLADQSQRDVLEITMAPPEEMPFWLSMLPTLIIIITIVLFWYFFMQQSQGGGGKMSSFGKSRAKKMTDTSKKHTFKDVAGADEEKEELQEIVEFLKAPSRFTELGARIPKGVLLVGPPGTGKTLLAKAVAGEANVPFFSISGSDFVEMFVGVGASRVRDLFDNAKKNSPCIVFIDEIDAVGRRRGAGLGGGHDEREQTLNQLLVEMDGFTQNENIIVIAATNRADILDPALLRPGRFDRQVYVGIPDHKGREAILKVHAQNKPIAPEVSLENVAKTTYGFTGADLENLLNEAALLTARNRKKQITMKELDEAMLKVVMGTEKKSRVVKEYDKKTTAYHEAGHAIASHILPTQDPVHQVSIIPRGRAGGFTMSLPDSDKQYVSKKEMLDDIVVCLAGRVAEEVVFDEISTGASSDLQKVTDIATKMVTKYGMSEKLGSMTFGSDNDEVFLGRDYGHARNYSEATAAEIDAEISCIVKESYKRTQQLIKDNMDKLDRVAMALLEHEKLDGAEFIKAFDGVTEQVEAEKEEE